LCDLNNFDVIFKKHIFRCLRNINKRRVHAKVGSKLVNLTIDCNNLLTKVEIALVISTKELKSPNVVNLMFLGISKGDLTHKGQGDLPIIFWIHSIISQRF
jgi:hypothetical protein